MHRINMANAGGVNLPPPAAKPVPALASAEAFTGGVLWAAAGGRRQEIKLGVAPEALIELPPAPPAGVLDARAMVGDGNGSWQVPLCHAFGDQGEQRCLIILNHDRSYPR